LHYGPEQPAGDIYHDADLDDIAVNDNPNDKNGRSNV
jgi:hypothetical protein